MKSEYNHESFLTEELENQASQWHRKLKYASDGIIKEILSFSEEINLKSNDLNKLKTWCEVCLKSKN